MHKQNYGAVVAKFTVTRLLVLWWHSEIHPKKKAWWWASFKKLSDI
jgi:hypothetical protein